MIWLPTQKTYGTGSLCVSMCSVWLTGACGCFTVWLWRGCGIKMKVIRPKVARQNYSYSAHVILCSGNKYLSSVVRKFDMEFYLEEPIFKVYKQMICKLCSDVHAYYQKIKLTGLSNSRVKKNQLDAQFIFSIFHQTCTCFRHVDNCLLSCQDSTQSSK
jgi:hypothetical protein